MESQTTRESFVDMPHESRSGGIFEVWISGIELSPQTPEMYSESKTLLNNEDEFRSIGYQLDNGMRIEICILFLVVCAVTLAIVSVIRYIYTEGR